MCETKNRRPWLLTLLLIYFGVFCSMGEAAAQNMLPAGLSSPDPEVRKQAVIETCNSKMMMAKRKIAAMAKTDIDAGVREAACRGLATMGAHSEVDTLRIIASSDPTPAVRNAAKQALTALGGHEKPEPEPEPEEVPAATDSEKYKKPELSVNQETLNTRHFSVGFGSMGGYGLASMNLRARFKTGAPAMPYIGIEIGGGWTPWQMYEFLAGPIDGVNGESLAFAGNKKWKIISPAGAVQLYFHRMHYVPIRVGWDLGRGVYTMLGYGFEHLNPEGFFSWGIELGILYQPVVKDHMKDLITNAVTTNLWTVIPFIRFSLQFYLV